MSSPAALPSLPPQLDLTGSIARLTLHRPEAANRLSLADLAVLEAHLEAVEQAASIRVLVLRAVGRSFCAGFDLRELSGQNDPGARFEAVADRLENLRQITVCCLEGGVYGGGTDLALACDFRIGSPACEMFVPAVRLGLHLLRRRHAALRAASGFAGGQAPAAGGGALLGRRDAGLRLPHRAERRARHPTARP